MAPEPTQRPGGTPSPRSLLSVALALGLLAVPLAGCTDGGGPDGEAPAQGEAFTAREALETGNASAEAWSSNASLAGVTMVEHPGTPDQWPEDAFDYTSDETVGDGQIPQWAYFYVDGEDHIAVYVNQDGETYQDEEPPGQMPGDPLADWAIDSDEAAEAAQEDENFTAVLEADDAEVLYALQQSDRGPVWWVRAHSESMGEEQTMLVNAETGEAQPFG